MNARGQVVGFAQSPEDYDQDHSRAKILVWRGGLIEAEISEVAADELFRLEKFLINIHGWAVFPTYEHDIPMGDYRPTFWNGSKWKRVDALVEEPNFHCTVHALNDACELLVSNFDKAYVLVPSREASERARVRWSKSGLYWSKADLDEQVGVGWDVSDWP